MTLAPEDKETAMKLLEQDIQEIKECIKQMD